MTAEVAPATELSEKSEKKKFEVLNVIVEKVTGTVKWFSILRCYGFIQRDDNKEDVFVHRTAISASRQRFPTLKSGEIVEFSVVETTGGINAASVTGPNGKPVKGFRSFVSRQPRPINKDGVEGCEEAGANANPHPHVNGAGGDIEGTRRSGNFRGGRGRRLNGRETSRPMHNGMGDQSERLEGEQCEDGISATGGAPRPRPRNWRGGRGRRGRGSGVEAGVDRAAFHQQDGGENQQHEDNGLAHPGESRPPRRGGRFRRGNRRQSGGNRHLKSESESIPPTGDHTTPVSNGLPLEDQLENMKISNTPEKLIEKDAKPAAEPIVPKSEKPVVIKTETKNETKAEDTSEAKEVKVEEDTDTEEEEEEKMAVKEVTEDKPKVTSESSN